MQGLQRSAQEKENYFLNHCVERDPNKTLHHIVPLDTWIDLDDFKLLDDWRNMIYIDKGEHDSIHDSQHVPYYIIISNNIFSLSDNETTMVSFENGKSVLYSHTNSNIMIDYNRDLIASRNG